MQRIQQFAENVTVIDGALPDSLEVALIEATNWMPLYFLNRYERYQGHQLDMHWYYPLAAADDIAQEDVAPKLRALDAPLLPIANCWDTITRSHAYPIRLYECVLSANAFGTEGRLHRDILNPETGDRERHHTALVYCCKEWNPDWGGETLVFNDDSSDIVAAILPRRGRIVKITGDPPHVGRSVARICPADRRVLVYKYWTAD